MFAVDRLILVAGLLLLIGIGSSKFSARFGLPVLVLFLVVGMIAGSEGIGGIAFDNYVLAHGIGTIALAVILFDGGLRTSLDAVRTTWKPAFSLATLGVLITAVVTGAAAAWILDIPILLGMLLGSIVGSTDAAAVFSVLRSSGVRLRERLANTLEIESASNDPMAIFLTVGIIEVLLGTTELGLGLVGFFLQQMVVGAIVGVLVGRGAVAIVNRINLEAAGMYPLIITASGLICFGIAAALGGSGFLAVFIAGVVIGNSRIVFQRGILFFHDAGAWLSQIVMFVVLGLLSFPSRLLAVWWDGLLIALVLMLVARPIAVLLTATPFGYDRRELAMISWVGLKGAVPITLATFPLMLGVPGAELIFDVVFFVVLLSALTQGMTLAPFARRLGLELPFAATPPVSLEITSLKHVNGDIVDFTLTDRSAAVGRTIMELGMPQGVVVAMVARGEEIIPPSGSTILRAGDHVFVVMRSMLRPAVNRIFAAVPESQDTELAPGEFPLHGDTRIRDLRELYDLEIDVKPDLTIADLFRQRLPRERLRAGATVEIGNARLVAHEVTGGGYVELVGLTLESDERAPAPVPEG
ncbi:MAG TPA: potassium/proton antiporter [Longimicrobiales bacterium]|nr:potassium/proton antiporter [Longimicrobiales bacterium]